MAKTAVQREQTNIAPEYSGQAIIPRLNPGTLLNQCRLHETQKHTARRAGTLLNQCGLHKTKKQPPTPPKDKSASEVLSKREKEKNVVQALECKM
jgi:hypothetical protein